MTIVGLVVEGTNDFPIVTALLESSLPAVFERPLTFRHLQPLPDATTGSYFGGGWGRVVGWCKANSGVALETYFKPVSDDDDPCDLILVQIDGDAMAEGALHSTVQAPAEPCSPAVRIGTLEQMLGEWLAVEAARTGQVRFALPVMQSEAWLMAALRPDEADWENEPDAKSAFRALKPNYPRSSMADFYRDRSLEAANDVQTVARQSVSFSRFAAQLATASP